MGRRLGKGEARRGRKQEKQILARDAPESGKEAGFPDVGPFSIEDRAKTPLSLFKRGNEKANFVHLLSMQK